jgi:hypothetical protein
MLSFYNNSGGACRPSRHRDHSYQEKQDDNDGGVLFSMNRTAVRMSMEQMCAVCVPDIRLVSITGGIFKSRFLFIVSAVSIILLLIFCVALGGL